MDIIAVGLSLRSASLPALEALSDHAVLARAESRVRALPGVRESVRLATCQRVLLLLGVSHPLRNASSGSEAGSAASVSHRRGGPAAILEDARRILAEEAGIAEAIEGGVTAVAGAEAFRHVLRLACGLESPLEGETEILGQIRAAYAAAVERGATGRIMGGAMHRVFRAARRIRSQAGFAAVSSSWGEFLAETIVAESGLAGGESVRVVGSGGLAFSLTTSLRARGLRVEVGAIEDSGDAPALPDAARRSGRSRVLVTASGRGRLLGASDPVLAQARDAGVALEIWDLGMPRNVDPRAAVLEGVRLRTLADIPALAAAEGAHRKARRTAEAMVEEETGRWIEWRRERGAAATLVRLGRMLEAAPASAEDAQAPGARAAGTRAGFRSDLLKALTAMAQEARDENEASAHLALFEEALRRATAIASSRPVRDDVRRGSPDGGVARRLPAGSVSLVGAGPGAGGLLTLEGARRLAEADVVYHDALVGEEVLAHCRPGTRLVPVGKRRGRASASQAEIEAALVCEARAGLAVVRLKGGDPFVFGRGGEEGLALRRAGVPFEIVPGVSSGIAAPALAGIPVTHRGLAGSAAFVTAHDLGEGAGSEERRARLAHLARGADTLVIFMAGAELGRVRATLLDAGLDAATPAALIESGATRDQHVAIGALGGLETLAEGLSGGPALVVVGRTVDLATALKDADRWMAKAAHARSADTPATPEATVTELKPRRSRRDTRRAG
jgi:uroporphyrin-III C-methyltransferase